MCYEHTGQSKTGVHKAIVAVPDGGRLPVGKRHGSTAERNQSRHPQISAQNARQVYIRTLLYIDCMRCNSFSTVWTGIHSVSDVRFYPIPGGLTMSASYKSQSRKRRQESKRKWRFTQAGRSVYCLSAKFAQEDACEQVYQRVHELIFSDEKSELSCFRYWTSGSCHVSIVGGTPTKVLDRRLRFALSSGEMVTLSDNVLGYMIARRRECSTFGPEVDIHHEPRLVVVFD